MKIRIFHGHSFDENWYATSLENYRSYVSEICSLSIESLSEELGRSICFELISEITEYGNRLQEKIRQDLRECDIAIIDISGLSPNVMYELGYREATGKPFIPIKYKGAGRCLNYSKNTGGFNHEKISGQNPADIADTVLAEYSDFDDLKEKLFNRIKIIVAEKLECFSVSDFWFGNSPSDIHIVCGPENNNTGFNSISSDDYLHIDKLDDRDALLEVCRFLSRIYPRSNLIIHSSHGFSDDLFRQNLLVIGGPVNNEVTKALLERLPASFHYPDDGKSLIMREGDREIVLSAKKTQNRLSLDVGYFGRFTNKKDPSKYVILCHGRNTAGTNAACQLFNDGFQAKKNARSFSKLCEKSIYNLSAIEVLFEVPVYSDRATEEPVLNPDFLIWR